ncbi:hypothetical protein M405DRAFT_444349 [Rhizopogon salebrosus TDB-379]|nr:hypothetical protein M405DRAFT_444349 [Rhizopogon salebrosus TDB-379]
MEATTKSVRSRERNRCVTSNCKAALALIAPMCLAFKVSPSRPHGLRPPCMHSKTVHSPMHVRHLSSNVHLPTILARWTIFHQVIWTHSAVLPITQEIRVVHHFSCCTDLYLIGYHDLYLPTRVCQEIKHFQGYQQGRDALASVPWRDQGISSRTWVTPSMTLSLPPRVLQRLPSAGYQGCGYCSWYERLRYHQRAPRCCYRLWSRQEGE